MLAKIYILALLYIYWICMTYIGILTVKQFKHLELNIMKKFCLKIKCFLIKKYFFQLG